MKAEKAGRRDFIALAKTWVIGGIALGVYLFGVPVQAGQAEQVLRIGGTGSALGGMRILADAFQDKHPGIKVIVLPSLGSGGGIKALAVGKIDMALSARKLKGAESQKGMKASEYARTPMVFATRANNPADDVSLRQLQEMYSGDARAWPDGTALRLIMRPEGESDIKLMRRFSPEMKAAVASALQRRELYVALNDQDNASALEKVPGSLGMTTLGQVLTEDRGIKPLAFNGVAGSAENLRSGSYPYFKSLYVVLAAEPSEATTAFVTFVASPEGRGLLERFGHLADNGAGS